MRAGDDWRVLIISPQNPPTIRGDMDRVSAENQTFGIAQIHQLRQCVELGRMPGCEIVSEEMFPGIMVFQSPVNQQLGRAVPPLWRF
jgi:hypothetical protein